MDGIGIAGMRMGARLLLAAALIAAALSFQLHGPPVRAAADRPRHPARTDDPANIMPTAPPEQNFAVKRILKIDGPMKHGDYAWDDRDVPAGPVIITIDLKAQTLSVFRAGYEIGTAVILYGADNMPTPLGTFPILQKDAHHVSNLYDAPMPYMLRLTNDGVSIHGSTVALGSATHGCIGVPTKFAALLFAQAKLGDRVIITSGKMLDLGRGAGTVN